jgi:hypothetical protein
MGFSRTGTTFLVSFYHRLGFGTGFADEFVDRIQHEDNQSHGGVEFFREPNLPDGMDFAKVEVIKHPLGYGEPLPWDIKRFNEQYGRPADTTFVHRILTRRDPDAQIKSSIRRVRLKEQRTGQSVSIPARLDYGAQLMFYEENNSKLVGWMGDCIEVEFPRSVRDFEYLWLQLYPTLHGRVTREQAKEVWDALANEEYVTYD